MGDGDGGHQRSRRWRRWLLWAAIVVAAGLVASAVLVVLWATNTPDPGPRVAAALESDGLVTVIADDGYTFEPTATTRVGFILYPGGRVDPASYAVPARDIAEAGFLVVVPELTLNLAVLDTDAADGIVDDHPEIDHWVIGGHSLGGTVAASYVNTNRDAVDGLVLWAAYPSGRTDLSPLDVAVASVSGTEDGLVTPEDIDAARDRLPPQTAYLAIEGGNHAQFGDYGDQSGDGVATISREHQQAQAVEATLDVLRSL